ncbi:hypothetical protein HK101_001774, partial [Irineochytrium annulatum]
MTRSGRYALCSCLLVSRHYFEVGAKRLWSSGVLPTAVLRTAIYERDDNDVLEIGCRLLQDLATYSPPSDIDGTAAPGTRRWRFGVYLASVRALRCGDYVIGPVPPEYLLPWLKRLDSVDVTPAADKIWVEALAEWQSKPGRCPRRVGVPASAEGMVIMKSVRGRGVHCLSIGKSAFSDDEEDEMESDGKKGMMASIIKMVGAGDRFHELHFYTPRDAEDIQALIRLLITNGASVQSFGIFNLSQNPIPSLPSALLSQLEADVSRLTNLTMDVSSITTRQLMPGLLRSNAATLRILTLAKAKMPDMILFPFASLHALKSLELKSFVLRSDVKDLPFNSMPSITRFRITTDDEWDLTGLVALMIELNRMAKLRDLSIFLNRTQSTLFSFFNGSGPTLRLKDRKDIVEVPFRLGGLVNVSLNWASDARLCVIDWRQIEAAGLPILEELSIYVQASDFCCVDQEEGWTFPKLLHDTLVDEMKTPNLAFADVYLSEATLIGKSKQYSCRLVG